MMIPDLLDTCEIETHKDTVTYKPRAGAVSDDYVTQQLDIAQLGIFWFHKALQRPGKAVMLGKV